MPSIGSLIREIDVNIQKFEKAIRLLLSKTKARVLNVNALKGTCELHLSSFSSRHPVMQLMVFLKASIPLHALYSLFI